MVSIGKLRAASLITIVYRLAENVPSARVLRALAILMVASCMVSVLYTFGQYAFGRGVQVYGVRPDSPLSAAKFVSREHINATPILSGDTLLEVNARKLRTIEDLIAALAQSTKKEPPKTKVSRREGKDVLQC